MAEPVTGKALRRADEPMESGEFTISLEKWDCKPSFQTKSPGYCLTCMPMRKQPKRPPYSLPFAVPLGYDFEAK
jgi:hypothetical protein